MKVVWHTYEKKIAESGRSLSVRRELSNVSQIVLREGHSQQMGIDTDNYVPTEADKQFARDYDYSEKHTQLESDKVRHLYSVKKKKKPN